MKTVTLCLAMVGLFFAAVLSRPGEACLFKKHKAPAAQTKTAKPQSLIGSPTSAKPSAFGGNKGTLWSLAETIRN
jgi:hypothetical protein